MQQSVLALQHVRVPVSADDVDGTNLDPTVDAVVMAFPVTDVDPIAGDWKTASWETDATTTPDTYYAKCLVGPGGTVTLAVGTYDVWVKVTDNPETPVLKAGHLEIV